MGLRRRNPRPSSTSSHGDWIDALQVAMRVDPALKPKRDRGDDADRDEDFALPSPAAPDYDPIQLADEPSRVPAPARPPPAPEKPWLPPTVPATPPPSASVSADPPAVVEDLFQWVCRLSRMRRAEQLIGVFAAPALRPEAERHLSAISSSGPVGLRLRGPLASFVDVVMTRAGLPLTAGPWRPLGPVPADRAYLSAAESAIADPTGLHDGTWAVHHAALSLVADLLPDGPAVLDALDAKLNGTAPVDGHICPAAYEGVFDHAIVRPVGRPLRAVAALAVGLLLLAVAGAVLLNLRYVGQLRGTVDAVDRALREPPPAARTIP